MTKRHEAAEASSATVPDARSVEPLNGLMQPRSCAGIALNAPTGPQFGQAFQESDMASTYDETRKTDDEQDDRARGERLGSLLDEAIKTAEIAWTMLGREVEKLGFELEPLEFENGTRYHYYSTLKFDALERSDDVHFALGAEARERDDRDLKEFEATFLVRESYSSRVKALALLSYASASIGEYEFASD